MAALSSLILVYAQYTLSNMMLKPLTAEEIYKIDVTMQCSGPNCWNAPKQVWNRGCFNIEAGYAIVNEQ